MHPRCHARHWEEEQMHVRVAQALTSLHRPVGEENASAQKVMWLLLCHSLNPPQQVLVDALAPKLS